MLDIHIFCVGKLKEKYFIDATAEYIKRLGAYCKISVTELAEVVVKKNPSPAEIEAALQKEYASMQIPPQSTIVALCIEGRKYSSEQLSKAVEDYAIKGNSRLVFVIGGSNGISDELKRRAHLRLSMSDMTFPHHLARVMLLEQLYRAFNILQGGKYHK